jgi:hypothetical protein
MLEATNTYCQVRPGAAAILTADDAVVGILVRDRRRPGRLRLGPRGPRRAAATA